MPKQAININFAQGLDTKTDPFQIPIGKFQTLNNSVFTKGGLLQKRNGFGYLPSLPDETSSYLTTFNEDLTAIGTSLLSYSPGSMSWFNKGSINPCDLSVLTLVRNNLNQSQADSVISPNGFICTAYTENNGSSNAYKYVIADSVTGQNIIEPILLSGADSTYGTPRTFLMGNYFIIVYTGKISATFNLRFIAVSVNNPAVATAPVNITTSYTPATSVAFDAAVLNASLYVAWNGASSSGIKMAYINPNLTVSSSTNPDASHVATIVSVCADIFNQVICVDYYDSGTSNGYTLEVSPQLALLTHFPVQIITSLTVSNITNVANAGTQSIFYEVVHSDTGTSANFINKLQVIQSSGAVGSTTVLARSVGLGSKAFFLDGAIYLLGSYFSSYQPTYFLLNSSGNVISRFAYQNGMGHFLTGVPSVSVFDNSASVCYLAKDLIESVNKGTNVPSGTQTVGVYAQTGVNLATFVIGTDNIISAEIGTNLNLTGGFLWAYDGFQAVEQEFFLYPEPIQETATATTGGHLTAQIYFYQVIYEWSDNQGNLFRSAPSIPISVDISGSMTSTNTITLNIPTLRLTYKTVNPVKITVYRWSTGQQIYYQTGNAGNNPIGVPVLNDTTVDSVTFLDTFSDTTILGNNIIYTTGGVIENIGPPATSNITLFDDRLWLVDAEDRNLLWFSKQVIESTPVEMSDLLTIYVAPTIGSQGSTGPMTAISSMDDKLIIFKKDAIYYINGTGPDNTGSNNQYSQPIFITASVGCTDQRSIVLMPQGLMFQSDKGIWLLGRDLSTTYIGAPVEQYNDLPILSSLGVPGTNQDRFTTSSGLAQMYDYYYAQWGTFSNVPALSSTLYQGKHTYISSLGQVFQETPNVYLDGAVPVLMNLTTGWLNLAGLQGFERAFFFFLLGRYITPFKLICSVAYDYNPAPIHFATINPTNFTPVLGGAEADGQETVLGTDTPLGGEGNVLNWRVFLKKQRCDAIQISLQEVYDPSFGVLAGAAFTLSGIQLVYAIKNSFRTIGRVHSVGTK